MKRITVLLLIAALLASALTPAALVADPVAETTVPAADPSGASTLKYTDYLNSVPQEAATDDIVISAKSAVTLQNATLSEDALCFGKQTGSAVLSVDVPASGLYAIAFTYCGLEGGGDNIEMGLSLDNTVPFDEAGRFELKRLWEDDGAIRSDSKGNQFAPEQKELFAKQTAAMRDLNGFVTEDLCLYLTAGTHLIELTSYGEPVAVYDVQLRAPAVLPTLEEKTAAWKRDGVPTYTGAEKVIEGESAASKTSRSLIGLSDNSTPTVRPNDARHQKVNYIGGSNWSLPDETITWMVDAPQEGVYKLGFLFRQNYLVNADAYRSLKVNGEIQYAEMASLAFHYANGWQFSGVQPDMEEVLVYLKQGPNELALTVTLGNMSNYCARMEELVLELGNMYREIVAVVGETPDSNRDYELFARVSDLEERMDTLLKTVTDMIDERNTDKKNIDDNVAMLKKIKVVLEKMLKRQYEAHKYKSSFYDAYSGLSARLQEMKNMALDIDAIVIGAPGTEFRRTTASFPEKAVFSFKRFWASFLLDYSHEGTGEEDDLSIWVNWSRDQTLVLNSLINSSFTPQKGIHVTIRMTNASLLQGILSGNGPDCALSESRTTPINLAMRGALVDLSQFKDYEAISRQFCDGADVPYRYENGVYALPSTQQFYLLFYRTDIFDAYGLTVPETWDDFLKTAGILMLNNMQVGLPYVELTNINQTNGGVASLNIFPSLLLQQGLSVYDDSLTATSFSDSATIRVFEEWTDYYRKYNLPKEYSFFNRFRVGLMPMAVQSYTQYSVLSAAAPEISGRWAVAEIPGIVGEDGTINNSQAGFGTGCVILRQSEHTDAAWELLKWWTSTETQYRYATNIESILGVAGRYTSANMEATLKLNWGTDAREVLRRQWEKVREIPEIPGGYYISRAIDQAFWNVLSMNESPKDMLKKWGEIAQQEIDTKIRQYSGKEG